MQSKLLGLLGLARRAGKLSLGYENVRHSIQAGKAKAVFYASDLSQGTLRRLRRDCEVPVIGLPADILELGGAVGQKCGCVSVDDDGFAQSALKLCRE